MNTRLICTRLLLGAALTLPLAAVAQDTCAKPDNSKTNKHHVKHNTADQQKDNSNDRLTTQKVRKAIMADKSLSTYAHNVKIITVNGAVTLKGPVHSDEEKSKVVADAEGALGGKVTDEITVKQ